MYVCTYVYQVDKCMYTYVDIYLYTYITLLASSRSCCIRGYIW